MKKITWNFILTLVLVMLLLPLWAMEANAETVVSGSCGEDVTWKLDDKGVLTISGSGPMYDFEEDGAPWAE